MTKHWRSLTVLLVATLAVMTAGITAAPAEQSVTFLAAGDFSANLGATSVLTAMGAEPSDLTLAVGDFSYGVTGQEQAWCDFVTSKFSSGYAFELVSGNHESNGLNGNINDFGACLPNQLPGAVGTYGKQYYVDVPRGNPLVRYIMISPSLGFPDGTYNYPAGSARYLWTANAIDSARTAGIPWVVVGMHKPCLTVGVYACDPGADLFNLLVSKKVDLVLSGHEHMYQRTKQLALSTDCPAVVPGTYNAACVADGDSALVKGAGLVSATVGTGGVGLRAVTLTDAEMPYFVTASGSNQNPSHGYLKVSATPTRLDASFVKTDGNLTDAFSIIGGPPPPNQPPVAAFTPACTGLTCAFDGNASADPDGTIASYAWSFGDTTTGTGPTPNHPYAAPGTYPVTLTVTDNAGATSTPVSANVTVTAPAGPTYLGRDDFERTVASGFGTAPVGGAWSALSGTSVSGGTGLISLAGGNDKTIVLPGGSGLAVDLRATLSADKPITGGGLFLHAIGRRVVSGTTTVGDYRALVRLSSTGSVVAGIAFQPGSGAEVTLASQSTVSGLTLTTGEKLNVRLQVTGASPTTLQLKVWKAGSPEPTAWTRTATSNQAGMQVPGFTGLRTYLSSSATNAPLTVRVDDWFAAVPQ
ncbi:MAG: PKD domain-containing protein [Nakamurella sp.]